MKPSSSAGSPSIPGPRMRGTATTRSTSSRPRSGSSARPPGTTRATAPVCRCTFAAASSSATAALASAPNSDSGDALGRDDGDPHVVLTHRAGLGGGHERELVGGQWPHRARRDDQREPLGVALLDVAQQTAVGARRRRRPPRRRARQPADGAAAGGDEQRVEAARAAVAQSHRPAASSTATTASWTSSAPASRAIASSGTRSARPSENGSATASGRNENSGPGRRA